MTHARGLGLALAIVIVGVLGLVYWLHVPEATAAPVVGGDPALADVIVALPGDVRASGKYSFFVLERENSSHRWFMRFDSEKGTLERLTADKGWMTIDSTLAFGR